MVNHEENFKPGDIITGNCTVGNNVRVIEQYHQWVTVEEIYRHGKKYMIDVVNNDVYRVFVGDF